MKVYISYSHKDKDFVTPLLYSLNELGIETWIDDLEIKSGDNIFEKIQHGLSEASHLIVVLSTAYVESKWTRTELNTFLSLKFKTLGGKVIPILMEQCEIPTILRDIAYYDFTKDRDYTRLIKSLKEVIGQEKKQIHDSSKKEILDKSKETSHRNQIKKISNEFKNGNLTLLCGAGISKDAGIPDWNTLIKTLLGKIFKTDNDTSNNDSYSNIFQEYFNPSPLIMAQYLQNSLGNDFQKYLREVLYKESPLTCDVIEAISELARPQRSRKSLNAIITYNFDDLIEQRLKSNSINYKSIYKEGQRFETSELPIFHVHGFLPKNNDLHSNSEIVFSEDAYHTQFIEPFSWSNLVQLNYLTQNLCVLVGLSLTDPNLRRLLDVSIRKNPDRELNHYIFKKRYNVDALLKYSKDIKNQINRQDAYNLVKQVENFEEEDSNNFGLNVIWVEDFKEIPIFLRELIK